MSISDNNFGLPEVPPKGEPSETSQSTETRSLGDHTISTSGEENPQVSGQGEEVIQHLGDESTETHPLPPGISITTSGGEHASHLADDIHFSVTSEGTPSLSRNSSFSSLSSLGESISLGSTRSSSPTPSSSSIASASKTSPSQSDENISPLPKYDPANKASIQTFLRDPRVLANMKEKGGHYIYPDAGRSSFIFIPNGDFNQAKSIKVTNGKSKEPIQNPQDFEMCISKFATAFNEVDTNWEGQGASKIRQDLDLPPGTPVKFTHFTLNLKYRQAIAYGPFNEKESSPGHTASAWRRGTKVKVNKDIWGDTGGLNSVDLSKRASNDINNENIHFTTETPINVDPGTSPLPGISPQPQQPPVVVNINVAGGQGGQGGSSTSVSHPQEKSPSSTEQTEKESNTSTTEDSDTSSSTISDVTTSTAEEQPVVVTEKSQQDDNLSRNESEKAEASANTGSENSLKNILQKVRAHLDFVNDNSSYGIQLRDIIRNSSSSTETSRIPSLALSEEPLEPSNESSLINAARDTSKALQNLLGTVINAPNNSINPLSTPPLSSPKEANQLETILKAVKAHIDTAYGPQGRQQAGGIAQVVKTAENSLQDIISTSSTEITPRIPLPSLNLPEEQLGNEDLINAAQNTSTALQNLLTTVMQAPVTPPPSPPAETNQLEAILKAVRTHVEAAYSPQGRQQAGGIAKVIKEAEDQ